MKTYISFKEPSGLDREFIIVKIQDTNYRRLCRFPGGEERGLVKIQK